MRQFIGIDAGGTRTRLIAQIDDQPPDVTVHDAGANLLREGVHKVTERFVSVMQQALVGRPPVHALVAGAAGAGGRADQVYLASSLRQALGTDAPDIIEIVHDGVIALEAAFGRGSGVLVIAGTGSAVVARTRHGALARVGGWGHLIGDEGSGHALGRRGLAAVVHAFDGGPATELGARLAARYGFDRRTRLLKALYVERWPLQQMAPVVLDAAEDGDAVAAQILRQETDRLVRQVRWLLNRVSEVAPLLCLSGGMRHAAAYRAALQQSVAEQLPGVPVAFQSRPSAYGALHLAKALAASEVEAEALRFSDAADRLPGSAPPRCLPA